jgi:hypothetical protein
MIETMTPELEQGGLVKVQIQTDVELRLRQAGIRALTEAEWLTVSGTPILDVNVHASLRPDVDLAAYAINVACWQRAVLDSNALTTLVMTWRMHSIGTVGRAKLGNIRRDVLDLVDTFINAYLSVNPPAIGASPSPRCDLIRQVQERLQAVGFTPGAPDGALGPKTQEALRWFQNTKGLVVTGEPDARTLDALGIR